MRRLMIAAFSFAAAVFLCMYLLPEGWRLAAGMTGLLLCVVCFALRKRIRFPAYIVVAALSLGVFWCHAYDSLALRPARELAGTTAEAAATVLDFPETMDYGGRVELRLDSGVKTRAYVYNSTFDGLCPGAKIVFTGDFLLADKLHGDSTDALFSKGVYLFANVSEFEVIEPGGLAVNTVHRYIARAMKEKIAELFSGDVYGFMLALIAGDRSVSYEDADLTAALERTGLAHIVSVSGMHVSILSTMLILILGKRRWTAAVIAPVLVLFMAVTGFSHSVVRSVIMQLFVLCAMLADRESDSLTSLSVSLAVILVINPYAARAVGLQLSFAATLGIVLITPHVYSFISGRFKVGNKTAKWLISSVAGTVSATVGATLFILPLSAVYFGTISVISPIANLLVVPAITPAFCFGVAGVVLGSLWTPLGAPFALCAGIFSRVIIWLTGEMAKSSMAAVYIDGPLPIAWLVFVYLSVVLFVLMKAKPRQLLVPGAVALASLFIILVVNAFDGQTGDSFTAAVLDVGQGQCIVLQSGEYTAVVDCGSSSEDDAGSAAAAYVNGKCGGDVDVMILTHYHADHANGVRDLVARTRIKSFVLPQPEMVGSDADEAIISLASSESSDIIYVESDMTLKLGEMTLTLFEPFGGDSENERGVCILASQGDYDLLITGDIDSSLEKRLVWSKNLPDIECLIVGHHGSAYSTCDTLLDATRPELAVVSVGYNNYGHPSDETLDRLKRAGCEVVRTDELGTVIIEQRDD